MAAHQAPPSLGFSRQEHWSGLPFPSPMHESEVAQSCPTLSNPMDCMQPTRLLHPWDFPGKITGVGCHCLLCKASLSFTNSWSLLKPMTIELVMLSNHLILCHSLLLPPSIFPSIRVFSKGSALCIRAKVLELQLQHQSFQ